MGVKCLAQEHNTMSPARARTRTARSGVERTSHEATAKCITAEILSVETSTMKMQSKMSVKMLWNI